MTSLYLFLCDTFPLLYSKMLSENVLQKEIAPYSGSDYSSQADLPLIFWKKQINEILLAIFMWGASTNILLGWLNQQVIESQYFLFQKFSCSTDRLSNKMWKQWFQKVQDTAVVCTLHAIIS